MKKFAMPPFLKDFACAYSVDLKNVDAFELLIGANVA